MYPFPPAAIPGLRPARLKRAVRKSLVDYRPLTLATQRAWGSDLHTLWAAFDQRGSRRLVPPPFTLLVAP